MITLYSIVKSLKELMAAMPNAGLILDNDIYELNHKQDVTYPAYCITQQQHVQDVDNEYLTYRFYLFYVDRLVSDKSNDLDVQSAGIQALKTIVTTMENNGAIVEQCSYNTFNQRFNDECAGAFCDVTFKVSADSCASFEISTSDIELLSKTITSNGSYTAPSGYAYSALTINVPTTTIDLKSIVITSNGSYTSSGDTAYSAVTVNVPTTEINNEDLTIVENGSYEADSAHTGLGRVVVNVPQTELQSVELTANGDYTSEDGYAYSAVTVNVPSDVDNQDLTITENGSYEADSAHTGLGNVIVNVPSDVNNQDLSVTENGTYEAESGYTGLGTVSVNVPTTTLVSTSIIENGTFVPASGESFSEVVVNVPTTELQSVELTANGTYEPASGYSYSAVTVNVPSDVNNQDLTIVENGTFEADSAHTGLGTVVVNVPQTELQSIEINSNGTYESEDGYAYSAVTVNVSSVTINNQDLTITENGSYEAESGYTGLGTVNVNVPSVTTMEITQDEYDALTEYDPYIIYLITE